MTCRPDDDGVYTLLVWIARRSVTPDKRPITEQLARAWADAVDQSGFYEPVLVSCDVEMQGRIYELDEWLPV
ncbi:hypothetical protein [Branchiibius sp. NY16-3462-2]|uniref:hypothetical protein n=1 Tax=Branchiibius sp. NY16-3462-2 TaxID=1807500 RepID=UPI00079ADD97|nr:hypothetical protein [Branchiibius sp. NY16-3462-2]KYH43239.1 hypothetical protein AZH51_12860 [Branchiibius sp. NY16-3462-2]